MKTLIVQGICKNNISDWEWKNFWVPCMKTVELWAERLGYDYQLYTDRIDNTFDVETWFPEANLRHYENVFLKFQWMIQWMNEPTKYDKVYWLDADILVWGNPELPKEEDLFFMNVHDIMGKWPKPNMSIWGGKTGRVRHFYDWAYDAFHYIHPEPALITCFKELCRAELIQYVTEEYFSTAYTQEHPARLISYKDCAFAQDWDVGRALGSWSKDMFYHLAGENKAAKFQRIMSYIMYVKLQGNNPFIKNIGKLVE